MSKQSDFLQKNLEKLREIEKKYNNNFLVKYPTIEINKIIHEENETDISCVQKRDDSFNTQNKVYNKITSLKEVREINRIRQEAIQVGIQLNKRKKNVIIIQKVFRGYLVRKYFQKKQQEIIVRKNKKILQRRKKQRFRKNAVRIIQFHILKYIQLKRKKQQELINKFMDLCASMIQKNYRNYMNNKKQQIAMIVAKQKQMNQVGKVDQYTNLDQSVELQCNTSLQYLQQNRNNNYSNQESQSFYNSGSNRLDSGNGNMMNESRNVCQVNDFETGYDQEQQFQQAYPVVEQIQYNNNISNDQLINTSIHKYQEGMDNNYNTNKYDSGYQNQSNNDKILIQDQGEVKNYDDIPIKSKGKYDVEEYQQIVNLGKKKSKKVVINEQNQSDQQYQENSINDQNREQSFQQNREQSFQQNREQSFQQTQEQSFQQNMRCGNVNDESILERPLTGKGNYQLDNVLVEQEQEQEQQEQQEQIENKDKKRFLKRKEKYDPRKAIKDAKKKKQNNKKNEDDDLKQESSIKEVEQKEQKQNKDYEDQIDKNRMKTESGNDRREESPLKQECNQQEDQKIFTYLKKKEQKVIINKVNKNVKSRIQCGREEPQEMDEQLEQKLNQISNRINNRIKKNEEQIIDLSRFQIQRSQIGVDQLQKAYNTNYLQKFNEIYSQRDRQRMVQQYRSRLIPQIDPKKIQYSSLNFIEKVKELEKEYVQIQQI